MSCHDIGRGANSIVKTVIGLKDTGEISAEAAKKIIISCANSVDWCDGNSSEAVDYISKCTCGNCLKTVPKGEKLYSLYNTSSRVDDAYELVESLANFRLCTECFDKIINQNFSDKTSGENERNYIETQYKKEDYTSTGEYAEDNNGYGW